MAIAHNSDFDRSRRTLYYELLPAPERIGAITLPGSNGNDKIPDLLPFSKVTDPAGEEYLETHPFNLQIGSEDELDKFVFERPLWAQTEIIEYRSALEVKDVKSSEGTTRADPEEIVLHEFSRT